MTRRLYTARRLPAPRPLAEGLEGRVLLAHSPAGPEFRVDAAEQGHQFYPDVTFDGSGNAVVVWAAENTFRTDFEIMARRLDAAGNAVGAPFQVNQAPTGHTY